MKLSAHAITGISIIVVGVLILLSNLNILPALRLDDWWPMVLIIGGALLLVHDYRNYLWASILILFGGAYQLRQFDIISVSPWHIFWPAVLVLLGVSMLMGRSSEKKRVLSGDRDDVTAIFSGSEMKVDAKNYKGSKVTAICGGVSLDLREAVIKKEATIDLFSFWGGIEIYPPKGVEVKNSTSLILGSTEDNTKRATEVKEGAPVLHIIGDVVMAGVEIKRS